MSFSFLKTDVREQKMLSWASVGILIFISSFLWSPARDGIQGVYLLSFFIPMFFVLLCRKPNFKEYGGWMTLAALVYAGYSVLSSLWGNPKDINFFILQWFVLAVWLCGTSFLFVKREFEVSRYEDKFVSLGVFIIVSALIYYYGFVYGRPIDDIRLSGWNAFKNSNDIGAMCGVIALLAAYKGISSLTMKRALLFFVMAALASIGLIASFSRGALLAFVMMSLIALFIVRPSFKIWFPPFLTLLFALAALFIFTDVATGFSGRSIALEYRMDVWRYVLYDAPNHFSIGTGLAKNTSIKIQGLESFDHAHNAWIDTFYHTGAIGLLLAIISLVMVLKHFSRDPKLLPLYLWLGYGCICRLVDSRCLFWQIDAKWFLYWLPIGLIIANVTASAIRSKAIVLEK